VTNIVCAMLGSSGGLLLASLLGAGSRGDLAIAIAWPTVAAWLLALGLPQAVCFFTARRPSEAGAFLVATSVMSGCLGAAGGILGLWWTSKISHSPVVARSLSEMFVAVPIYMLTGLWTSALQAVNVKLWNFARLVQPIVYVTAITSLGVLGSLTVQTAVRGLIVSLLASGTFSGVLAYALVGVSRPKRQDYSSLMGYGLKSWLAGAPSLVNIRVDQLILSLTVSSAAVGQYALATSLAFLAMPVSTAFGSVAFPRIARMHDQSDARVVERRAVLGSLATAVLVLAPLAVIAPFAFPAFFGSSYADAVPLFMILAPATVVLCFDKVAGDTLRGRGKPLVPAIAEGVGALVTISLLLVLIPTLGVIGAAVSSLVAYIAVAVVLLRGIQKPSPAFDPPYDAPEPEQLLPQSEKMMLKDAL
jgi:enterobacterial common antigen flippase